MTEVSVITATLNSSRWLQRCIDSVLAQQNVSVQHVLIDGGSTDGTIDMLKSQTDPRIRVVLGRDSGVFEAWNKGLRVATGDWILFLGSDDFLLSPEVFELAMQSLRSKTGQRVFAYGELLKGNADGTGIPEKSVYIPAHDKIWGGPTRPFPPHPSTFHGRALFLRAKPFDESYRYSADAKFFFENAKTSQILSLQVEVTWFSIGGLTNRPGNQLVRWRESDRLRKELEMKPPLFCYVRSLLSAIKWDGKHLLNKLWKWLC